MTALDVTINRIDVRTVDNSRMLRIYHALISGHTILADDIVFAMDTYLEKGNYVDAAKLSLYIGDRPRARNYSLIYLNKLRDNGQEDKAQRLARLMFNSDYIDGSDVLDFFTDSS